jgi:uncharacterized protein YutE (UPF0331/DUF86 family)
MNCAAPPAHLIKRLDELHSCAGIQDEEEYKTFEATQQELIDSAAKYEACLVIEKKLFFPQSYDSQVAAMLESEIIAESKKQQLLTSMIGVLVHIRDNSGDDEFSKIASDCIKEWSIKQDNDALFD